MVQYGLIWLGFMDSFLYFRSYGFRLMFWVGFHIVAKIWHGLGLALAIFLFYV